MKKDNDDFIQIGKCQAQVLSSHGGFGTHS